MTETSMTLADVRTRVLAAAPDALEAVQQLMGQADPETPAGGISVNDLNRSLSRARNKRGGKPARRKASNEAWLAFLSQPHPIPARFGLGDVVVELYNNDAPAQRQLLHRMIDECDWGHGLFAGFKRVFKLAEQRLDAPTWARLVVKAAGGGESSSSTRKYMQNRAWRFLRDLGRSTSELFPWWSAEIMRRDETRYSTLTGHIVQSWEKKSYSIPATLHESWKASAAPLWLILETNVHFAKRALIAIKKLHPKAAAEVEPALIGRLCFSDKGADHHQVAIELLDQPRFALSELPALGLHGAMLALLRSDDDKVVKFAIEYARAHLSTVKTPQLVDLLLASRHKLSVAFLLKSLQALPADSIGADQWVRLMTPSDDLSYSEQGALKKAAADALLKRFSGAVLPDPLALQLLNSNEEGRDLLLAIDDKRPFAAEQWMMLAKQPFDDFDEFGGEMVTRWKKRKPCPWSGRDLVDIMVAQPDAFSDIGEWLGEATDIKDIDVERLKGCLFDSDLTSMVMPALQNRKLVAPRSLGIPWLLALAKRKDERLADFARRVLLEHMKPDDFDEGKVDGVARLTQMALSSTEPVSTRRFAQTYLSCHHPVLGPVQPEAKELELEPQLTRKAYVAEAIWPGLTDSREDVRKFALAITKAEARRWKRVVEFAALADTEHVELRRAALDAMLNCEDPTADAECTLKPSELTAELVYPLLESRRRPVRDGGMQLVRIHYAALQGEQHLAWLMTSADRTVRRFAVELLWERHRWRAEPASWKPKVSVIAPLGAYSDAHALAVFLRRMLFSLPPGRAQEGADPLAKNRRISQGEAKARIIEVVRDLAVHDAAFATIVLPLLQEMSGSIAQGEWQGSLQATHAIMRAHPALPASGQG
jgi:hypothetical protein